MAGPRDANPSVPAAVLAEFALPGAPKGDLIDPAMAEGDVVGSMRVARLRRGLHHNPEKVV